MILFITLLAILFVITVIVVALAGIGGVALTIIFGDAIVCAVLIICILRYLTRRK